MRQGTEGDGHDIKRDLSPETRSAWARMKFSLRSIISIQLFSWAMDVAPEEEQLSIAIALHEHIQRTMAMRRK
jgi:hypothetical protein